MNAWVNAWVEHRTTAPGSRLGRAVLLPPKTRASRRVIPLPEVGVTALREHAKKQEDEKLAAGETWQDTGFVFTTRRGATMSPYTLGKYWRDLRDAAGLGTLRFHDLRHAAVSLLLALGVPPHVVREIAGHSDIKVTMTVYAHGNLSEKAAALGQLEHSLTASQEVHKDLAAPTEMISGLEVGERPT